MRINEVLVENQNLEEGPILNKIGTAVGKGIGAAAKGVGAVAGGIAGLGKAFKKGYQAGKGTVGGAGDDDDTSTTSSGTTSGSGTTSSSGTAAPAAGGPKTTAAPAATSPAPAAAPAAKPAPAAAPAPTAKVPSKVEPTLDPAPENPAPNDTTYAQAQKAVGKLQPTEKQEIVTMLQNDPKVQAAQKAAADKAAAKKAAPVAKPTAPTAQPAAPAAKTAKPAPLAKTVNVKQKQLTPAGFGQMVQGLSKGS